MLCTALYVVCTALYVVCTALYVVCTALYVLCTALYVVYCTICLVYCTICCVLYYSCVYCTPYIFEAEEIISAFSVQYHRVHPPGVYMNKCYINLILTGETSSHRLLFKVPSNDSTSTYVRTCIAKVK